MKDAIVLAGDINGHMGLKMPSRRLQLWAISRVTQMMSVSLSVQTRIASPKRTPRFENSTLTPIQFYTGNTRKKIDIVLVKDRELTLSQK